MKAEDLTLEILSEALCAHPKGDIPFSVIKLGSAWHPLASSGDRFRGLEVQIHAGEEPMYAALMSDQRFGYHVEELDLKPGDRLGIERMLRSGQITVVAFERDSHWWYEAGLAFATPALKEEFADLLHGGSNYSGSIDLPKYGLSIRKNDSEILI